MLALKKYRRRVQKTSIVWCISKRAHIACTQLDQMRGKQHLLCLTKHKNDYINTYKCCMGGLILQLIITLCLIFMFCSCGLYCVYLSAILEKMIMTCIHFVYIDHQEATVVLDINTQLVASDGNKYSVYSYLINRRWPYEMQKELISYQKSIWLCLLQTYVGHVQILSLYTPI